MKTDSMCCCLTWSRRWITQASLLLVILAPVGALAQDAAAPGQKPAEMQTAPPQVVPVAQVPVRAQELREMIDELKALSAPDPSLDTIAISLRLLGDSLSSKRAQSEFKNLERLAGRALTDVNSRWQGYRALIKAWESQLVEKSGNLAGAIDQLNLLSQIWISTRDSARALKAPLALTRQIRQTITEIDTTKQNLERRFRDILSLQEAVTAYALPLNEDIKRIDARREQLERQIFVVDALPLWKGLAEADDTTGVVASVHQSWAGTIETTVRYLRINVERAVLHLLLSLAFFVFFLLIRRQAGRMAAEESLPEPLPDAVRLLRRPGAAALLVLVFLARYFYPDIPVGLTDFLRILAVVPFLIMSLTWFKSPMRVLVLALAVLYVLELTTQLISDNLGGVRLLLLAQGAVGVSVIVYGLRPDGVLRSGDVVPRATLVRRLAILALVLLIGAVVANIFGSVSFARRLTTGVTVSAANAAFFGILVLLADGALLFAVRAWMNKVSRLTTRFAEAILRIGMRIFAFGGLIGWLLAALGAFDLRGIAVGLVEEMLDTEWGIGSVQISAGDILLFALVLIGSFALARVLRLILEEEVFSRVTLPRGVPGAIAMVVRYTVVALGIVLALAALGLDLGKFGLLAGALGVGRGFGLQHVVANFVSGIILAFERPIQVGDMVQMGSLWGTITSIGVRSTRVRSFDGSEVVIPNNDLISKEVTNWTLSDRLRRLSFPVKVEFGSDPRQVIEVMLTAVREHEVPLSNPEPFVIFGGLGEYYLDFTLYFWITTDKYLLGKNEVGIAVLEALKKAGIQIPSAPHRITIEDHRRSAGDSP